MASDPNPLCLAYYCSGHGYGHATRVSAFARYLLSGKEEGARPIIYIVSSAPKHVFSDSIACGARYRYAEIDPVIVQPLAYRVDRRKSVEVLKKFLDKKDELLDREKNWLLQIKAHSVLSDAAFLGCLAAKAAGLPSVLITNFSFDSVYSYLSTPLLDETPPPQHIIPHADAAPSILDMVPDVPIPHAELSPLVKQIHAGYRCADLLVRLPGHIPIPSFCLNPPLPSYQWLDMQTRRFRADIMHDLTMPCGQRLLHPSLPFSGPDFPLRTVKRTVLQAPLLVRPPSSKSSVYTPEGRSILLSSIGIPPHLHDPLTTKILIVSFGGQVFRRPASSPSRPSSRAHSRNVSRENLVDMGEKAKALEHRLDHALKSRNELGTESPNSNQIFQDSIPKPSHFDLHIPSVSHSNGMLLDSSPVTPSTPAVSRLATPCHIWIPGAPPATKPLPTPSFQPSSMVIPTVNTIPPTPNVVDGFCGLDDETPRLLPDESWIAVVCGVSKEQWNSQNQDEDSELPEGFYVAPRDVYMPDLTAVGDVLLGKLGYGTVSECVDACTPFVYVSRPLFIEEHGLRLLLDQEGVGVELSRQSYEAGDWASAVTEALAKGKDTKEKKRSDMGNEIGLDKREEEGRDLAGTVTEWVRAWWKAGEPVNDTTL
ncbi:hypothetical protein GALMADRAFT_244628 [Galerina marginata CBS 339.88]|uniref:L-arabinokinase n=1 Tax=Galerina marginata (strain CBS 339.88) TaxID=685588 RepID=A0A067T778_GALM3|nr:hypothetical protein GALMADRAFT_244628 [Galerina marginata CBS 339.88]